MADPERETKRLSWRDPDPPIQRLQKLQNPLGGTKPDTPTPCVCVVHRHSPNDAESSLSLWDGGIIMASLSHSWGEFGMCV